jgi:hypothetical protein
MDSQNSILGRGEERLCRQVLAIEFDTRTYRYINILLIYRYVTHFLLSIEYR